MRFLLCVVLGICGVVQAGEIVPFVSGTVEFSPVPAGLSTDIPFFWDLGGGEAIVIDGRPNAGAFMQDGWRVQLRNMMPFASPGSLSMQWRKDYAMISAGVSDFPYFSASTYTEHFWSKARVTVEYDGTLTFVTLGFQTHILPAKKWPGNCDGPVFGGWTEVVEFDAPYRCSPSNWLKVSAFGLPGADFIIQNVETID